MPEATALQGLEERRVEVAGRRVRYFTGGSGPPIVLVHGLGGAASNWVELVPLLAGRHRLVVPDLPGHGRSEPLGACPRTPVRSGLARTRAWQGRRRRRYWASNGASEDAARRASAPPPGVLGFLDRPVGREAGLDAFADAVAACAEREALGPAAVVGHSLGGEIALRLALDRPRGVRSLVLAATSGISCSTLRNRAGLVATGFLRPGRLAARFRNRIAASPRLARACFLPFAEAPLSPLAVLGFLEASASATDTGTAARALLASDVRSELDGISCPVLLLWGARDRIVPAEDGFEYARRLHAPLRTLPATGHLLIAERPVECAALLEEFLRGDVT